MTARAIAVLLLVVAHVAHADPDGDADRAFHQALQHSAAGDSTAIDELERLGSAQPNTRWTDDAWAEAARLAERTGDFARARRDLERVIAVGTDPALVRRARAALARLTEATGGGVWDRVAREHERLVDRAFAGGDPRPVLAELEQLARDNPGYPGVTSLWLLIAEAYERDGAGEHALGLLRDVTPREADRERFGLAFARIAIRRGALDEAALRIDELAARPGADLAAIAEVRSKLAVAEHRARLRHVLMVVLALLAAAAVWVLRRDCGNWRAAGRAIAKPPLEVVFLLPVSGVLVAVSRTGNPLVARALLAIVIAGLAVAWVSGALLEARRVRIGRIGGRRAVGQALLAVIAIASASYIAVDRDRMLDLVSETWEHGPAPN